MNTRFFAFVILLASINSYGLALRSFVSMPIDKGGVVGRLFYADDLSSHLNTTQGSIGIGLAAKHTVFFAYPAVVAALEAPVNANIAGMYRYVFLQKDSAESTFRLATLAGLAVPQNNRVQGSMVNAGGVGSYFHGRHEIDFDGIYAKGYQGMPDMGRYDVSWQYRIWPSAHAEWGLEKFVNTIVEYNGRWMQSQPVLHQTTLGLQMVSPQWIVEAGYIRDLNVQHNNRMMVGVRIHI